MLLSDKGYDAKDLRAAVADRRPRRHPAQVQSEGPDLLLEAPLQGAQPQRGLLQQDRAVPLHRNPLRQDRRELLAAVKLVSIRIWLRGNESTARNCSNKPSHLIQ